MSDDFNGPFRLLTRDVVFLGGPQRAACINAENTRGVAATSHLKALAQKLKYGAMAVRHRMRNRVRPDRERR